MVKEKIDTYVKTRVLMYLEEKTLTTYNFFKIFKDVSEIMYELSCRYKGKKYAKVVVFIQYRDTNTDLLIKEEKYFYYNVEFTKPTKNIKHLNGTHISNNEKETKELKNKKLIKI